MCCHRGLVTLSFAGPCYSWNAGKKFMGNVDAFLKSLLNFDKDNVPGGERCALFVRHLVECMEGSIRLMPQNLLCLQCNAWTAWSETTSPTPTSAPT